MSEEPRSYPFSEPDRLNLDPAYAEVREAQGLVRVKLPFGRPAWLATRYEDVRLVLGDPRFSRAQAVGKGDEPSLIPFGPGPDTIVAMDPPEHTRLRRVVAKAFTMRRIDSLRPWVQKIVDDLLDEMEKHGSPIDLVESFARPQPGMTIFELMGIPYEDRPKVQKWTDIALSTLSAGYTRDEVLEAAASIRAYLADQLEIRRNDPKDDLLGVLVSARDEQDRLTEQEMVNLGVAVVVTGNETTADQITNFTYLLLTHPQHMQELRDNPGLVPQAVEEMLRYTPLLAGTSFPRVATEDVVLGEVLVRAGDAVLPSMMSANRDGSVFANPDVLDFHREDNPHLGTGHGVHRCLGAQLAKMELEIALSSLLKRFPQLRLATAPEEVTFRKGTLQRAPQELLIAW
ncbi:cytochrome P450 [Rhizocola hellebori]|uniref:Cytochrome P450 n=1 Tax=Rhizocola hellebori TaxID=1392758 RepID=A0A8J3QEM6_9ACTN|nr:cytochrome P450 [Rhizocola hellebori]